jgi:hypothetical protein
MKSLRFGQSVVLLLLSTVAFARSGAQESSVAPVPSEAQKSFATMKSLAGEWVGPVTTDMSEEMKAKMGGAELGPMHVSLRVTSRGNALVHEMQEAGTPLDAAKYDHPVTMFYVDGDQLALIHYCDAGNRPHMTGKTSPDGKTVEFAFVDVTGKNQSQHMHHALFTLIDADHHIEDWTFMIGDQPIHAHFDLHREHRAASPLW